MPPRRRNLPDRSERLTDLIIPPVADAILVHGRSHGVVSLPGEFSTDRRHAARCDVSGMGPDGWEVEEILLGTPERYHPTWHIWNYRDSAVIAKVIMTERDDEDGAGTARGAPG